MAVASKRFPAILHPLTFCSGKFVGNSGVGGSWILALIVLAALSAVGLTVVATSLVIRRSTRARVESHIEALYAEIQAKAVAAAAANVSDIRRPLVELVGLLNEKLGPLLELGGPVAAPVGQLGLALNLSATSAAPNPSGLHAVAPAALSEDADLQATARDFSVFWQNKPLIKGLIRNSIHNLCGDEHFM